MIKKVLEVSSVLLKKTRKSSESELPKSAKPSDRRRQFFNTVYLIRARASGSFTTDVI